MATIDEIATLSTLKDVFRKTNIGSDLPDHLLEDLLPVSSVVNFMPEDTILTQGEVNNKLYFLILGDLEILVDGNPVNALKSHGDLVGEMSVITKDPCSATIRSQTPVQLLCIDTEKLEKNMGPRKAEFDALIYRIYSRILTEKLSQTNQKAKRLETTTRALQKAKSEIQEVHRSMELRVAERITGLKKGLENLLDSSLVPMQESLRKFKESVPEGSKEDFNKSLANIEKAIRTIEPLASSVSSELSIKNKNVLFASTVKKNLITAKMALGGTGVNLETVLSADEAESHLKNEKYDLVILDDEIVHLAKEVQSTANIVYLAQKDLADHVSKIELLGSVPNILAGVEEDRALQIKNIMTTVSKLASDGIFGLEKYLNWGVDVKELPVTRSDERAKLRAEMAEYFSELGVRKSIIESIDLVAEEMLMNAIYDAPMDMSGNSKYNKLSRQETVILPEEEQGRFRFGTDGTYAAISVDDPFGGLTASTILKYLGSCYEGRAGEYNKDKGGAGRGLHQIIENSTLVIFNVQPGKRTEVIALFYIVPGDKRERSPQFHYFTA